MNYINNAKQNRKKQKNKNVFIIIISIIFIFLTVYIMSKVNIPFISNISSGIISFVDGVKSSVVGMFKEGFSYFGNTKALNEKIDSLENQIEKNEYTILEMEKLKIENEDLKEDLKINEEYAHFKLTYANLVYKNLDNIEETFVINKGSKNGIKEKQTVISSKGLVGYISRVDEYTSEVKTILSPNVSVSANISSINQQALIKGDYILKSESKMKLTSIPIDYEISLGDVIYTSGIGGMYKKGIKIGNITKIVNKKNDIDRYAEVVTSTDFKSIYNVAVISE